MLNSQNTVSGNALFNSRISARPRGIALAVLAIMRIPLYACSDDAPGDTDAQPMVDVQEAPAPAKARFASISTMAFGPDNILNVQQRSAQISLPRQPAGVVGFFPSGDTVPENLLKFHLHFATAMAKGHAHKHIKLTEMDGQPIPWALLDPVHELWDPFQRHLTVYLDPARVKTGLNVHETLGRALVAGREYRMIVTRGWPTAAGQQLRQNFEHCFRVTHTDADPPIPCILDYRVARYRQSPTAHRYLSRALRSGVSGAIHPRAGP